jgi:hypothetical protein
MKRTGTRRHPLKALRISSWLSTALAIVALGPLSAGAFEVAEISMKELSDLSIVDFESSFCEVVVGDTVTVALMGTEGDAATATIVAASLKPQNGATPNRGKGNGRGGARTGEIESVILADGRSIDVMLTAADDGWHTVHVRLELDTGDKLGVNLHSTPCEEEEGEALLVAGQDGLEW